MALLDIRDLSVTFRNDRGTTRAVDGVSLAVEAGETLAIVGESGSGKSVTSLAVMGLLPPGAREASAIRFDGTDLLTLDEAKMRSIRGREIAMVFQDPMTSLNPVLTVGRQLTEMFELHMGLSASAAWREAADMLRLVGVPEPEKRLRDFPHHFSGGMRQRVMIAMAVACRPKLLIADEPTTALDVTIQAQILELIARLQSEFGMSIILITHDLGVVAGIADRMAVMYSGRIVEEGPTEAIFAAPKMPYTQGLLRSVPRFDVDTGELRPIRGTPPTSAANRQSCSFAPRCDQVFERCLAEAPPLVPAGPDRRAACFLVDQPASVPA